MHWVMILAKDVKIQFVPLSIVEPIFLEMEQRGVPDQTLQSVESGWLESPWRNEIICLRQTIIQIPFDGLNLRIPVGEFEEVIHQVSKALPRWSPKGFYFKIHGKGHILCILESQKPHLLETLHYHREKANLLLIRDWAS